MSNLVGDADAGREEDDGAVGVEGVETAVGSLHETRYRDDTGGGGAGAVVKAGGHTGAFSDDHIDGVCGANGLGEVEIGLGGGEFFGFEREVGVRARVGPGNGEGVAHPEGEGGEVNIGVGTGDVFLGTGELKGHSAGFDRGSAGEGFDGYFGEAVTGDIAVEDTAEAGGAVEDPEGEDPTNVIRIR